MPSTRHRQLEELLRTSADPGSEPAQPETDDPVARRVALYAELLRLAPPAENTGGRLLLADAAGGVRAIPLTAAPIEIGRAAACAVRLDDPEISRHHCRVSIGVDGTWLEDLGAANGTWLNDQRMSSRAPLHDGDVIRVGRTLVVFARP